MIFLFISHVRRERLPEFILFLLWGSIQLTASPIEKSTIAIEGHAKVAAGGEVRMLLHAIPYYGNTINFEITTPPRHGIISGLTNDSDNTAIVTYRHDGSTNEMQDSFLFRAKAPGCTKSPSCQVTLEVISPPPLLVYEPERLDFPSVFLSDKASGKVTIRNVGGGTASGQLILPKGFSALEGAKYIIRGGESQTIIVEFCPMEEGPFKGRVGCPPNHEKYPLILNGTGVSRFELIQQNETEFLIRNKSGSSFHLSCSGGEGWVMPPETAIEPHGETKIVFYPFPTSAGETLSPISRHVAVGDGLTSAVLDLPPPPRFIPIAVEAVSPAFLGVLTNAQPMMIVFRVSNNSLFPKKIQWTKYSHKDCSNNPTSAFELLSGESKQIKFDWTPIQPGSAELRVLIDEGSDESRQEILWTATVTDPISTPSEAPQPRMQLTDVKRVQEEIPSGKPVILESKGEIEKKHPPVEAAECGIRTNWFGMTTPYLKWDRQDEKMAHINLELKRKVSLSPMDLKKRFLNGGGHIERQYTYTPVVGFHHQREHDCELVLLPELSPGYHTLTLTILNDNGQPMARSDFPFCIPIKPSFLIYWKIPLCFLAMVGLLFLYFRFR